MPVFPRRNGCLAKEAPAQDILARKAALRGDNLERVGCVDEPSLRRLYPNLLDHPGGAAAELGAVATAEGAIAHATAPGECRDG